MSKDKKDNVIEFPRERIEASHETPSEHHAAGPLNLQMEHKKVVFSASLLSVLLLAILVNRVMISSHSAGEMSNGSRSIASVSDETSFQRDTKWEHDLADKLAKSQGRQPASIGSAPSLEDQLRFEKLEGNYVVHFDGGKLSEVQYSKELNASNEPKTMNDRFRFIKENRQLMPVQFETTVSKSRVVLDDRINEVYALMNGKDVTVGEVRFELDTFGRLLSMKVITTENLK